MQNKSVYKYAAEAGVPVGIYFILVASCFLLCLRVPVLQNLVLPLLIIFPFILAYLMKRMTKDCQAYNRFSPLWLFGIYSVIFGTLICMLYSLVFVMFIEPGFVAGYARQIVEQLESLPSAENYAATTDLLRYAIDSHQLPTGAKFVTTMGWFSCFAGSILSLILALIISRSAASKRVSMFR